MLNQVSEAVKRSARVLTIRHPNSVDVEIYRKVASTDDDSSMATMGGAMLLSMADNADYDIERVSLGRMLFLGHIQGADMTRAGGLTYNPEQPFIEAYIEPTNEQREFEPCEFKKDDRVFWIMPNVVIEYQIKVVRSPTQLPPYVNIYVLEPLEHEPDGDAMP